MVTWYQPATDDPLRFQLEGDLLQTLRDLHGAAGPELLRRYQPLSDELFTREQVDGGYLPGKTIEVLQRRFCDRLAGKFLAGHEGFEGGYCSAGGNSLLDHENRDRLQVLHGPGVGSLRVADHKDGSDDGEHYGRQSCQ
ncbi:hypothetical protein QFZ79_002298 [Arthrobacter sp. V4I6]|nr:hypothetical protein [Arthrobacter sp. V1I7]MDQ0854187.1 hypothetical protein [Arthrobacter sp. V4I6]